MFAQHSAVSSATASPVILQPQRRGLGLFIERTLQFKSKIYSEKPEDLLFASTHLILEQQWLFVLVSLELGGFQFQQTSCKSILNINSCASQGYRIDCRACDREKNMEAVLSFLGWLSLQVGGV